MVDPVGDLLCVAHEGHRAWTTIKGKWTYDYRAVHNKYLNNITAHMIRKGQLDAKGLTAFEQFAALAA